MQIIMTDGNDKRFVLLCGQLDQYLNQAIGTEKQQNTYDQYNQLKDIHDVVLIMEEHTAVGCGSFKKYDDHCAEIKRVFVTEKCRGKAYGHAIIQALEQLARQKGFSKLILETGKPLTHAQKLYASMGYQVIENFGQYKGMKDSICMSKQL